MGVKVLGAGGALFVDAAVGDSPLGQVADEGKAGHEDVAVLNVSLLHRWGSTLHHI